jgi:hypothetical protein
LAIEERREIVQRRPDAQGFVERWYDDRDIDRLGAVI